MNRQSISPQQPVQWVTGARVHFGLLDIEAPCGGAGMMVDGPPTRVEIEAAERFEAVGPAAARVTAVAERFARWTAADRLPACRVRVLQRPDAHSGLGTGTQLALAVAAALDAWHGQHLPPDLLARQIAGRGTRSEVGSQGFFHGGLIVDPAGPQVDPAGPHDSSPRLGSAEPHRLAVSEQWRVLLVRPAGAAEPISGDDETHRFDRLPPVTPTSKEALQTLLQQRLVPAVQAADFDSFSEAVYAFNHHSGMLFAAVQGGAYHGPAVAELIQWLRDRGLQGVGQSSWGPTVFVFCRSAGHARQVAAWLTADRAATARVQIVRPLNRGALILPHSGAAASKP